MHDVNTVRECVELSYSLPYWRYYSVGLGCMAAACHVLQGGRRSRGRGPYYYEKIKRGVGLLYIKPSAVCVFSGGGVTHFLASLNSMTQAITSWSSTRLAADVALSYVAIFE